MKKTLKIAVAASVLTVPAMAANLENPLYIPKSGQVYTKTGAGVMYKKTDSTAALKAKNHAGAEEFPIWRLSEDAGYGITDRLSVNAKLGYTNDEDIARKGLHNGRVGLLYRVFDGIESPFVWDVYADLHLGGLSKMEATVVPTTSGLGFDYANYTNGRWGFFAGTRVGKTWDKFTGSVFGEIHQTFGNNNNKIELSSPAKGLIALMTNSTYANSMPNEFNVDLKSTTEYMTGVNGFYQFNETWSFGSGFSVRHRATNTIEKVNLYVTAPNPAFQPTFDAVTKSLASGFMGSMDDGLDEYVLSAAVSNQITETVQISLYGEYTFDDSDRKSQNGTDVKAEVGVRANVAF